MIDLKNYKQLTFRTNSAYEVADNINKDFFGAAIVHDFKVYITKDYYNDCKKRVLANCKFNVEHYQRRKGYEKTD